MSIPRNDGYNCSLVGTSLSRNFLRSCFLIVAVFDLLNGVPRSFKFPHITSLTENLPVSHSPGAPCGPPCAGFLSVPIV